VWHAWSGRSLPIFLTNILSPSWGSECKLIKQSQTSGFCALLFDPEDGISVPRNVSKILRDYPLLCPSTDESFQNTSRKQEAPGDEEWTAYRPTNVSVKAGPVQNTTQFLSYEKFWDESTSYFPLIWHGPHVKRENYTHRLPSNDKGGTQMDRQTDIKTDSKVIS
jgi:hypothetical protein